MAYEIKLGVSYARCRIDQQLSSYYIYHPLVVLKVQPAKENLIDLILPDS